MIPDDIQRMFNQFSYTKSSDEITLKMKSKIEYLTLKVKEREDRITKIRKEYDITDAILIDLLQQARAAAKRSENRMSYSISSAKADQQHSDGEGSDTVTIGAGVVNNLLTENDFIESERAQINRLSLIIRNLRDEERDWSEGRKIGWQLREEELKYLGF